MTEFNITHAALFDELERLGIGHVDVRRLTIAALKAKALIDQSARARMPYTGCCAGSCDS